MSKPISISFGKSKSTLPDANISNHKPRPSPHSVSSKAKLLGHDSDDEDESKQPIHEPVTGFTANGAVLGEQPREKELAVIKNAGNEDWRKRRHAGKNTLPSMVQAPNGNAIVVEKDEVSKASGLQYARKDAGDGVAGVQLTETATNTKGQNAPEHTREWTEDEIALQALLQEGQGGPKSTAIILQKGNTNLARPEPIDELGDYRADVASRPDSATLDEYEAMPVEEFGLALLRGMGTKRKANGQVATIGSTNGTTPKTHEPRPGYLGVGAKPTPGMEEIGAWGRAAMRKGMKGQTGDGLYTPVMLKDRRTGELITEEELEARKKEVKEKLNGGEDDWREKRDKNLRRSGRDWSGEPKRLMGKDDNYRDERNNSSRRDRSRSRDRKRRDDGTRDEKYRDGSRDRERDRRRDKYRDDDRYDSSSSRKSRHRDGERNGYDKDDDRRRKERY
jgi:hypothetical protein